MSTTACVSNFCRWAALITPPCSSWLDLSLNSSTGEIISLRERGGHGWTGSFAALRYNTISAGDLEGWRANYLVPSSRGNAEEYGKPQLAANDSHHGLFSPVVSEAWLRNSTGRARLSMRMAFAPGEHDRL